MNSISYWLDIPYVARPSLENHANTDVVVIGGGITGISTAYHCAKQGLKTILIEKDTIASGPAGRNGGMVVEGRSSDFANTIKKVGLESATRAWRDTVNARELVVELINEHKIDCDFKRPGTLYIGASESDAKSLRAEAEARNAAGFPCEILEKGNQLKESVFDVALFTKNDCLLHPVKFLRSLAQIAESYGAVIYEHTPAISFDAKLVTTKYGVIHAERVVVATESDNLHALEQNTNLIRSQALVTAPLPSDILANLDWTIGEMLWTTEDTEYASVRRIDNRLFICKALPLEPTSEDIETNKQWQLNKLKVFFPKFPQEIEITHQWSCRMLESIQNHPYIGIRNDCYEAFGHSGNGLTNGMMAGKMLAEHFGGKSLSELYSF
jgi:gamma-glutamylputrescine oxidase